MKNTKTKIIVLALAVALVAVCAMGTVAFFTDRSTATNVITTGGVDIELLETAVGRSYGTVNIFGGGCQDQLCNQFVADACGRRVVAGPIDASSIGNIVVQMLAHGELSGMEEAKAVIRNSFDFMEFVPRAYDAWNRHYPDFLRLFEENSPA